MNLAPVIMAVLTAFSVSSWPQKIYSSTLKLQGASALLSMDGSSVGPTQLLIMTLHRNPIIDTTSAIASIAYEAMMVDDTGGVHHELDSLITWSLKPTGTSTCLSAANGGVDTLFLRQAYTTYIVKATYTDYSTVPPRTYSVFDTVFVTIKPKYKLWIEPDTNIDPNGTAPQMLARLRNPDPVTLVSLNCKGVIDTVVAVKRDQYGNFVGFPSNVVWQVVGDTGIVRISTPVKPYLCNIEGMNYYGNTFIRVSDDSGSIADTVPARIPISGEITKIKLVNTVTGEAISSININVGQEISIKVMNWISTDPDTTHWFDVSGLWTLTPDVYAAQYPLPPASMNAWSFKPTMAGGPSVLTVTTGSGVTQRTVSIPVTVSSDLSLERLSITKAFEKAKSIREYYNLRGQKLRGFGNSRVDGIVLERVIGPDGKVSVDKKFLGPDSRMRNQE